MAKKNALGEVKNLGNGKHRNKTKAATKPRTGIFAYSDEWEYWMIDEDEDDDDWDHENEEDVTQKVEIDSDFDSKDLEAIADEEFENWVCLTDGSLEDCLEEFRELIRIEVSMIKPSELGAGTSLPPEEYFTRLRQLELEKVEAVRTVCLHNGEYKEDGILIRSVRTREQCEWIAKNGKP